MEPWSVMATASIPYSLHLASRSPTRMAPSSRLYWVWTWRWTKLAGSGWSDIVVPVVRDYFLPRNPRKNTKSKKTKRSSFMGLHADGRCLRQADKYRVKLSCSFVDFVANLKKYSSDPRLRGFPTDHPRCGAPK